MSDLIEQEWPKDFTGWQPVTFTKKTVKRKLIGAWLCLNFTGVNGESASWDGNLFTSELTDGRKIANRITMGALADFFRACGLDDANMPEKSIDGIDKALTAFENEVTVSGRIGKDEKGYNRVNQFKKVQAAA